MVASVHAPAVGVRVPREVVVMECLVRKEGFITIPDLFPRLYYWRARTALQHAY